MERVNFEIWLNHFEYHARHPRRVCSEVADRLSNDERCLIANSIATFQLGEQSGGSTLLRAAQRFARRRKISQLARITELFIREEQHHARLLREFMAAHGIATKHSDWTDQLFRRVRRLAGFELYLHVLVSAELIGIVYYRALEAATGCERLKAVCRMLVADELAHVGYESSLLLALRSERNPLVRSLLRLTLRAFFKGIAAVVWFTHRAVWRQKGYDRVNYLQACMAQFAFYLEPVAAGGIDGVVPARAASANGTAKVRSGCHDGHAAGAVDPGCCMARRHI